jgi:hypothetical protein
VEYITCFIRDLYEQTVPWKKPSDKGQSWWNSEVQEAVWQEREARRRWRISNSLAQWEEAQEKSKIKRKVIAAAKRKDFREAIHKAAEGEGI